MKSTHEQISAKTIKCNSEGERKEDVRNGKKSEKAGKSTEKGKNGWKHDWPLLR